MTQNSDTKISFTLKNIFARVHGQKHTINKVTSQMTNYKKTFAAYIRDKGLTLLIQNF